MRMQDRFLEAIEIEEGARTDPNNVERDMDSYGWLYGIAALTVISWAMCLSTVVMSLAGVFVPAIGWTAVGMSALAGIGWVAAVVVGDV